MPDPDWLVAGVRCNDVLADLSAYLDGDLPAERRRHIEAHLKGCDWCERFGGEFSAVVPAFRQALSRPTDPDPEVRQRLRERLKRDLGAG
jgi:anti-sigma factor RsiW